MQDFEKYLESLDEGKIVLKRRYTENYPEKNVRQKASIRNTIIEALRDKKLTLSEFNEIVSSHSKSPSKWTKRNSRFFKIEEDSVTLSSYGNKILSSLEAVNEASRWKGKEIYPNWVKPSDIGEFVKKESDLVVGKDYVLLDLGLNVWQADYEYIGKVGNTHQFKVTDQFAGDTEPMEYSDKELKAAIKDLELAVMESEINEGRKEITKKHWDKADDDQREEWLLQAFSDSDDAIEHVEKDWEDLPDEATSNMYESVNEARAPKNWDSMFTMKAIEAYKNGEFDLEDDKSIAEWDKEYNGGRAPKPAFNTKEVVSYAIETGKKPNGDKIDEGSTAELEDFVRHLSDKQYNKLATEYKIDTGSRSDMEDFIRNCSDKESKKIIKKYSQIKEMVHTKFTDYVNESYNESAEINEALKSSKLRGLLSMKKSPKTLLKGIYGQTKIALDKVEDHQIIDVDPKDGPKQDGYVFYYTTQAKENPYASGHYNTQFPENSLLALAKGKKVFYVRSRWSRKGAHEYSLTTDADGGRSSSSTAIGPNKSYSGWDASGLGSLSRVISIADAAFVVNPEALETTGNKIMQRSQAKEGAIAFKDDKEFKDANMARYKEILTKRSSTLDVDKEVVKAIEEIADIMKEGIKAKKKDRYNQIIMGTGKNGKTFRINDLSNFTNNLMSDYERWAQYTNDAENAKARLEKEGADTKEEQWEVRYNEREALKYAKDIKDRLKKLKSKNLGW
jgi:hypothetical protein